MTAIVSTRDVETGQVIHHMAACDSSNYGTLCAVSTDDNQFIWVEHANGQKVTCKSCTSIWTKAREYRASDIAKQLV